MKVFNRNLSDVFEKMAMKIGKSNKSLKQAVSYRFNKIKNKVKKTKTIQILCVFDRSCNIRYLEDVIKDQKAFGNIDYKIVDLKQYLEEDESKYDILIYQTWSCEEDYAPKADDKFRETKLIKVFFDAGASGSFDTYYRFKDPQVPRIKNAPHSDFLKNFNVILKTSHPLDPIKEKDKKKDIDFSYCLGLKTHPLRPKVYERLLPWQSRAKVDLKNNQHNYIYYLRRVKISINMPGYGEGSFRHLYTLNAKSLCLAHDSIDPIQLLPYATLIPGEDYISFTMDNLDEKMQWCLDHPKEVEKIAQSGYRKFILGYDKTRSTHDFLSEMKKLIN